MLRSCLLLPPSAAALSLCVSQVAVAGGPVVAQENDVHGKVPVPENGGIPIHQKRQLLRVAGRCSSLPTSQY